MTVLLAQGARPFPDWTWFNERNIERFQQLFVQHVQLTALALLFGLLIAAPLAVIAVRWRRLYGPLLSFTGVLFTIPSAALIIGMFAFLPISMFGLRARTSVTALTIYTLLILFRNTVTGLNSVPPDVTEAATAMGYTRTKRLLRVEFPLALPVIIAGVRIAAVTTLGLVTITAFIGQGGFGQFFITGFQQRYMMEVSVGVVASVVLAVLVDVSLVWLEKALTPWSQSRGAAT